MAPPCVSDNDYDGKLGVRISAIFVILVGSALGAIFPVFAERNKGVKVPAWAFFIAKYFGSGVIVATAFIHLLGPANEALTNECLTGPITEYTWPQGICLISVYLLFFVELMTMRFAKFAHSHDHDHDHAHGPVIERGANPGAHLPLGSGMIAPNAKYRDDFSSTDLTSGVQTPQAELACPSNPYMPGDDHLSHAREHTHSLAQSNEKTFDPESYGAQMTALFILEFGVIFHSIFIGLTLAVSGSEFTTLYAVLALHQTFEGLALGSRLASTAWPESKKSTPYYMALGYALSTPLAIAIGLAVRTRFNPGSQVALITNGVFDSVSAGILIYTGLVELMAHEFMFSVYMQRSSTRRLLAAYGCMVLGALAMAILGKWA